MSHRRSQEKSNPLLSILKFLKEWWFIAPIIGGFVWTFANLPPRVEAIEKKTQTVEQRTEKIERYIEQIEEQKELIKKAPAGWLWDEKTEQYVPDPNYVPPKKGK